MQQGKSYWFRARRFGYGWTPNTWQGWAVTLAWVAMLLAVSLGVRLLAPRTVASVVILLAADAVLVAALIAICRAKGEPARWRWGK